MYRSLRALTYWWILMPKQLVVLHGWSDEAASFERISRWLSQQSELDYSPTLIQLGDYVTLDDDVTMGDIVVAMQRAWQEKELSTEARSVDVVLHSTGGLIVRHWMTQYFQPDTNPIHRLLMLAPANFGSPLAHRGRSFLGRMIKGRGEKRFQTGTHILKALEIASPYSWGLAIRDRFFDDWYGPGRMLCTVLIGNRPNPFPKSITSEIGSDGTIRVSTANLDCDYLRIDFTQTDEEARDERVWYCPSSGTVAFGVMDHENHSTIAFKDEGPRSERTMHWIQRALSVDDQTIDALRDELATYTAGVMADNAHKGYRHGYMNLVLKVRDDVGNDVPDYFVEFSSSPTHDPEDRFTARIHRRVLEDVHPYGDDPSLRSLYLDITDLEAVIEEQGIGSFWLSLNAEPVFTPDERRTQRRNVVGYHGAEDPDALRVEITPDVRREIFRPNRTVLAEIIIPRLQADEVFRFLSY